MLFAKINPAAKAAIQDNAFLVHGKDCEWMTASTQYNLGQSYTLFQISFGNFINNPDPTLPAESVFDKSLTIFVNFTNEELADWGEDDSIVFSIIASKIGTTVVEVIDKPDIQAI
jgi:hypothetical protein